MADIAGEPVGTLLLFIVIAAVTLIVARVAYLAVRRLLDPRANERSSRTVARVVQYFILVWGLYLGLVDVLHLDLLAFAASLGIITLVVAFSGQQILSNIIAGVLIAVERPFRIGDWVQISSTGLCKVKEVGITNTYLRGANGTMVSVPNSSILTSIIQNYSQSCFVQVPVDIDVPITADFGKVVSKVMRVLEEHPGVLPIDGYDGGTPLSSVLTGPVDHGMADCESDLRGFEPRVLITKVTPSTVSLEVRLWIHEIQERDQIRSEVMSALLGELRQLEAKPSPEAAKPEPLLEAVRGIADELKRLREQNEARGQGEGGEAAEKERLPVPGRRGR